MCVRVGAQLGADLLKKKHAKRLAAVDLPRGDPAERSEVLRMLKEVTRQQYVIVGCKPTLDGRIAQVVRVDADGQRQVIINDAAPSEDRPYYEKSAVTSAFLQSKQLRPLPAPPPPAKAWPLDTRFTGLDAPAMRVAEQKAAMPWSAPSGATPLKDADPGGLRERDASADQASTRVDQQASAAV